MTIKPRHARPSRERRRLKLGKVLEGRTHPPGKRKRHEKNETENEQLGPGKVAEGRTRLLRELIDVFSTFCTVCFL